MKKFSKHLLALLVVLLLFGSHGYSQAEIGAVPVVDNLPQFFICILAGVLLAIGFQILLTSLSVASGISLIGNLEESANNKKKKNSYKDDDSDDNETSTLVKISSAAGIWTVVTVSISLFFASWLAIKLSLIGSDVLGIVLGLVIWAAFFSAMMYFEVKMVSSLIGGLFSTVKEGINASVNTLKATFEKSQSSKIQGIATDSIEKIREEISRSMDSNEITKKMDEYVEKLKPEPLDYNKIKKEILNILEEVEFEEETVASDSGFKKKIFVEIASRQPNLSKEDINKISSVFDEAKGIAKSDGSTQDKILKAVDKFTPGTEEDTQQYRSKLEKYLRNTGREELNPDNLKRDFEEIFNEPAKAKEVVLNRINEMDRSTLVAVLSQRKDISKDQANNIAAQAEKALSFVKDKILGSSKSDSSETKMESRSSGHGDIGSNAHTGISITPADTNRSKGRNMESSGMAEKGTNGSSSGIKAKVEEKLQNYFNSMNRPEFNYNRIKRDFEAMFHDPKSALPILKSRLNQYDKESLITLLSSNKNISHQDAENMVNKILEAKENVISKAEHLQDEVNRRVTQAKEFALHEAENVRKAAVAASWWLFATGVISAIASALGGILALS